MNDNIAIHTVLKRSNDITINIKSLHTVEVSVSGKSQGFSNNVLLILNIFSKPVSLSEAIKELNITRQQEWMQVTQSIHSLLHLGALVTATEKKFTPDHNTSSFGASRIHMVMLNDRVRTDAFIAGIKNTIKEGDVVLDIGTGSGILAIAAARAGAKRVYAIEASAIADVAQDAFNRSEVAEKITLLRGWSTQMELPEKADVLVSEIIGNDPFTENILPVFRDTAKRLLKQDAMILPGLVKVYGLPVNIPQSKLQNMVVQEEDLTNWKDWYNIDLAILKDSMDFSLPLWKTNMENLTDFTIFDEPILLAEIDFYEAREQDTINTRVEGHSKHKFNGMLMYFDLGLGETMLTNNPLVQKRATHWLNLIWYLPEAEKISAGNPFNVQYSYSGKKSELRLII